MTAISWLIICAFAFLKPTLKDCSRGVRVVTVCVVLPASAMFVYGMSRWMWENMI
jgi:hypothetical protein